MRKKDKKTIDEIFREGAPIDRALKKAVKAALLHHKQAGNPVAAWRNGKIIWLKPEEIPGQVKTLKDPTGPDVPALEKEINHLVYKLHTLTSEEIAIVEGKKLS